MMQSETNSTKSAARPAAEQALQGQNYLKAVESFETSDSEENGEAFRERIEALARQADYLAREIAGLRWVGLGLEPVSIKGGVDFYEEVRRFEISLIIQALRFTGGSQKKSALLLKMNHTTLNTKIKSYRIKCEALSVSVGR